ncbi:Metallo-beta-lactamase family protein, RNA-specific [Lunatimonas lonarensis]|uniref:Metallo-beta-lactamase family protein, RNA-specific n=1 Tax=Lunatimonas lonarensis TaxID=1232681 RepID=R7ZMP4_9BACT|nr:MBL fold metallo-hydrolase [Lunatimonas lonarensis]EON75363.1 Metallo-beta-lactamase family protein, RNA-specific [Lunatimonas lonarensis]
MNVRVKFLGGAGTVTGSRFLLEIGYVRVLVDCGLFQGMKDYRLRNWEPFPVDPAGIDMVLLTHAHIDHSGYLPKLVKEGFSGPIYCTEPTLELVKILLLDAGKLQEEEAEYAQKKGYSKHEKPEPLFNIKDAERVFPLLEPLRFEEEYVLNDVLRVTAYNAGHILGAAILKLKVKGDNQEKKIVFSGDLGRYRDPILNPPADIPFGDVVFMESTYGNRVNENTMVAGQLAKIIKDTYMRGGVSVIPSFAVGRTQLILYMLHRMQKLGAIPDIPIYVDSPMAIDVTQLYKTFGHYHHLGPFLDESDANPFLHKNLHYYKTQDASMTLNHLRGDAIIISASGMATGGRILHHLYNRLPNEDDSVIFVGFQPEGTRGRKLLDGDKVCRIYGVDVAVKASVHFVEGLSAHADQRELVEWSDGFIHKPKMAFMVHGEKEASQALAGLLKERHGWNTLLPDYMESFELFSGI